MSTDLKKTLERFLMMTPGEVLEIFSQLPGAVVHKRWDYVFVPGTRQDRVLLVGHADTVSNRPPDSLQWLGNLLRGQWEYRPTVTTVNKSQPGIKQLSQATGVSSDVRTYAVNPTNGELLSAGPGLELVPSESPYRHEGAQPQGTKALVHVGPSVVVPANTAKSSGIVLTDDDDDFYSGWYSKCLGADDRAGIAMLWLMRRSGHSLLITDHEETGGQGARSATHDLHDELSDHVFAVQIDRHYDQEMVFYECSTDEFEQYMTEKTGFDTAIGTFTDISIICPAVGICGVNLAAGYWNEHSSNEMLSFDAWRRTYNVVHKMLWKDAHKQFKLPPRPARGRWTRWSDEGDWWADRGRDLSPVELASAYAQGYVAPTTAVDSEGDDEIMAYQVGQMIFCAERCSEYVMIAEQDNRAAKTQKLRAEDICEWDVCETCGTNLWRELIEEDDDADQDVADLASELVEEDDSARYQAWLEGHTHLANLADDDLDIEIENGNEAAVMERRMRQLIAQDEADSQRRQENEELVASEVGQPV